MEDPIHRTARERDPSRITFHYSFAFDASEAKTFDIVFSAETLNIILEKKTDYPEWTRLSFRKCPNCPLHEESHPFCPAATSLADVVGRFQSSVSYEDVTVTIESEARKFQKRTPLSTALASLIGLVMVTSGCPIMKKLRPMVRFHLPFATTEETVYRVISMYLTAQYFRQKNGQKPDWELKGLFELYNNIKVVNRAFSARLKGIVTEDASLNALTSLDAYAQTVTFVEKADELLDFLKRTFADYLEPADNAEDTGSEAAH